MSGRVFQVDDFGPLVPYTYETDRLAEAGISLDEGFCETPEDVISRAGDAEVLWVAWKPSINRTILEALPMTRLVIRWGIGFEQIDIEAATRLGIAVANAPTYGTEDVAEHTLALLLALERRIVEFDADMRTGGWKTPEAGSIRRLQGLTVGLLGVGRIGAAFARRAKGIGLNVIGYDPYRSQADFAHIDVEGVTLDELAARSDFVSIHVPHTHQTDAMVDAGFLGKMRNDAYLINTSRGKIIDQADLVEALRTGAVAGAGLDVFETEPLPEDHPLRDLENVILTPHYAGYSAHSWADLREEMCRTTIDFLSTGWASTIVNPGVSDHLRSAAPRS